jgi:CHAT domain-containing protein
LKHYQERMRGQLDVEIVSCIGPEQCKPIKILELILNQTFDIVHYSGHGKFDADKPNNSGWVFSHGVTLSAREIFRARQVPRLVFANACFSAVCNDGVEPSAEKANQKLAGLAEAFFERGVQNYIGTGWEVDDTAAARFAQVFYEHAMSGKFLGDALADARRSIFSSGSSWGAYQHYGQSNARVV